MRNALIAAMLVAVCPLAMAQDGWHKTKKQGIEAAKQSGKAILYVTSWKPKV